MIAGIRFLNRRNLNPTRVVVLGFLTIILLGTVLLCLPIASRAGTVTSPLIGLFTATSATCVTGLIQVDTYLHWTFFGQLVILVLLQLGGLGFVSLITLVSLILHQRIGLSQRLVMASAMNLNGMSGVVRVVRHALIGTFLIEGIGAVLLSMRFIPMFGWAKGIWFGIFHSISAFCNGGFDLLGGYSGAYSSLAGFQDDPLVLLTIMALIVAGGLGFFVWEDWLHSRSWKRLCLYSKLVLGITSALIVFGWVLFLALEWDSPETLGGMSVWEKCLNALFQSVTLRTAGFATLNQGALQESSTVLSMVMMLVGGSSGSTAGGIKTVTAGILMLALKAGLQGRSEVVLCGRTIPQRRVLNAMTLAMTVIVMFFFGSMLLSVSDGLPFLHSAFEVASALGTVGVTVGITPGLNPVSSLLVIAFMFLGRVGILSFSIAFLTQAKRVNKLRYPTVDVMVG